MTDPRRLAVEVVARIRRDEAYANLVVPSAIGDAHLDSRDAALVTDLVYGSTRWRGFLDSVLERCAIGGLGRLDDTVLDLLRVAGYDLLLRRTPGLVVNEWVTIARAIAPRAGGLINAVLRRVSERSLDEWRSRVVEGLSDSEADAILTSHPLWIVDAYRGLVGVAESRALLDANNEPPVPTLVALPGVSEIPADATRTELSPFGFRSERGNPSSLRQVRDGTVRVQDEGSQLAALLLVEAQPIAPGERWLDLCAGPGGKTAVLATLGRRSGVTVEANEIHPHRAALVRAALKPVAPEVVVSEEDGRDIARARRGEFDRVLVDVPCTGLGALRRRPESRWRKTREDLVELVPLQRDLLAAALEAVRVGGIVAYVTCSPLAEETVEVVDAVLDARADVERIDTPVVLRRIAPTAVDVGRGSAVQLYPHRHRTDAMFIQLIRRTR